jgi:hypothetical protein
MVARARRRNPRTIAAPSFSLASSASSLPPTPSPPSDFWWRRRTQGESPRRRGAQGAAGWGGFIGRRPRVWMARVGGEDSVQGVAWPSSRAPAQQGRGGGHGAGAGSPLPRAPPRCVTGRRETGRKG